MKSMINRRQLLANSAALATVMGLAPTMVQASIQPQGISLTGTGMGDVVCRDLHPRMADRLANLASDPALSRNALSHAIKTWHCPKCQTHISSDFANHTLMAA